MEINIEDSIELNKKLHSAAKDRTDMEIICLDGSIDIWSEIITNPPDDFKYIEYDENSKKILILENNRVKIVKIVFDFMQFNELPAKFNLNFSEVCELLILANKYKLTAIIKRCSNILKKSKSNIPTIFTLINIAKENKINDLLDCSMNKLQSQSNISIHAVEIYSLCDENTAEIKNEAFKTITGYFGNSKVQYICNVCKVVQTMNEDCIAPKCRQRGPITHMYNNMCSNFHLIDAKRAYLCSQYNRGCNGVLERKRQQIILDKIPDSISAELLKKNIEYIKRN